MGTHTPKELLNLWKKEDLSLEKATGHSLQNIADLATKQTKTEAKTNGLEHTTQNIAQDQEKLLSKMKDLQTIVGKLLTLAQAEWQSKTAQAELKTLKKDLLALKDLPITTIKKRFITRQLTTTNLCKKTTTNYRKERNILTSFVPFLNSL